MIHLSTLTSHISTLPLTHFHLRICHPIVLLGVRLSNLVPVRNKCIQFLATFTYYNFTIIYIMIASIYTDQYCICIFSYALAWTIGRAMQSNNARI